MLLGLSTSSIHAFVELEAVEKTKTKTKKKNKKKEKKEKYQAIIHYGGPRLATHEYKGS